MTGRYRNSYISIESALSDIYKNESDMIFENPIKCRNLLDDLVPQYREDMNPLVSESLAKYKIKDIVDAKSKHKREALMNNIFFKLSVTSAYGENKAKEICEIIIKVFDLQIDLPDKSKLIEKKIKHYKKVGALCGLFVAILLIVISAYIIVTKTTTVSVDELNKIDTHGNKTIVASELKELGFKNVNLIPLDDIGFSPSEIVDSVDHIDYSGIDIDKQSRVNKGSSINVYYHSLTSDYKVRISKESREYDLLDLNTAKELLINDGFTNISDQVREILPLGNIDKIGKVSYIKIDETIYFVKGTEFQHDLPIIIYTLDYDIANKAKVPKSASDYVGVDKEIVIEELKNAGFTNISITEINDITNDAPGIPNTIKSISFSNDNAFIKDSLFPKDASVIIDVRYYSDDFKIAVPKEADDFEGENYKDVVKALEEAGFINIELSIVHDINWINKLPLTASDGDVESISIGGKVEFEEGDLFPWKSKIEIVYHSK